MTFLSLWVAGPRIPLSSSFPPPLCFYLPAFSLPHLEKLTRNIMCPCSGACVKLALKDSPLSWLLLRNLCSLGDYAARFPGKGDWPLMPFCAKNQTHENSWRAFLRLKQGMEVCGLLWCFLPQGRTLPGSESCWPKTRLWLISLLHSLYDLAHHLVLSSFFSKLSPVSLCSPELGLPLVGVQTRDTTKPKNRKCKSFTWNR